MAAGWVYQGWVNAGYVDAGWVDAGSEAATVEYLPSQRRRLVGTSTGRTLTGTSTTRQRLVGTSPDARKIEGPMR